MLAFIIIIITVLMSYYGFNNTSFIEANKLEVDKILINKEYKRLLTSGFLHVSWTHLVLNMLSLYFFSGVIENEFGALAFLVIYFSSLVGGGLLALLIHKNHGEYSAVGASGAVCGIVFATIALVPDSGISFFGIPFSIPGWIYALVYVLYSMYGIRSKKDNIGHEAHLGGALLGMFVGLCIYPSAFADNYPTILLITIPSIAFIYLVVTRPQVLMVDNFFFNHHKDFYSIDHKYNAEKHLRQQQVDHILDKINKHGMSSLTAREKKMLKEFSKTLQ